MTAAVELPPAQHAYSSELDGSGDSNPVDKREMGGADKPSHISGAALSHAAFLSVLNSPDSEVDQFFKDFLASLNICEDRTPDERNRVIKILNACQGALALPGQTYSYGQLGDPLKLEVYHPEPMPASRPWSNRYKRMSATSTCRSSYTPIFQTVDLPQGPI